METGNFSINAEDLSTIGGIATVSLLHSFIPTHWLPFSIVGRAQKWTLSRTLLVTAFGAVLHVLSTSLLGITAITITNTIAGEETVHKLASLLLIVLGGSYIILYLNGKGGHSHSHNQPMEKMAVAGLVLVPALSPCATTLPVFLAVGNSSSMMVLAIIVLLFSQQLPQSDSMTTLFINYLRLFSQSINNHVASQFDHHLPRLRGPHFKHNPLLNLHHQRHPLPPLRASQRRQKGRVTAAQFHAGTRQRHPHHRHAPPRLVERRHSAAAQLDPSARDSGGPVYIPTLPLGFSARMLTVISGEMGSEVDVRLFRPRIASASTVYSGDLKSKARYIAAAVEAERTAARETRLRARRQQKLRRRRRERVSGVIVVACSCMRVRAAILLAISGG
ncbi:hypothetical protein STAS_32325 [Striga asiatica]|uniref:Uncharacterized protein n=1 Tax=Striga asiatica TaxID=4170 RepID=A0A5A7RBP9_STRAF|nr:hypothetical protein STAS_32325 [Striga asiatica]